jgi:hypothetical protein
VRHVDNGDEIIWVRFDASFHERVRFDASFHEITNPHGGIIPRQIGYNLKIEKTTGEIELEDDT